MYTQQQQPQQFQAAHPAARLVQETVMRLKDLDVRLEALNHDLAQLCDSVGNTQAAQIARTPRQALAANLVGAPGQAPQGQVPTNANVGPGQAPQANWSAQAPSFAPSPFNVPQAGYANSALLAPQFNATTQMPSQFASAPFLAPQANWASQVPPQFASATINTPQTSWASQVPSPFVSAPFQAPQASWASQVPSPFVSAPYHTPQTNWASQVPNAATNPYAANSPYAANNPYAASSPYAANNPYAASSPYAANNPYAAITPSALLQPYGATSSPFTAAWNTPHNSIGAPQFGFSAGIPSGAQAPFSSNMIR